jgi:hypothetical protein
LARSSNQRCARRDVVNASGSSSGRLEASPAGRLRRANTPSSPAQHHLQKLAYHTPFSVRDKRGSRLSEPVREVCILATAREFNNAFEWAAHEREAIHVGVPAEIIQSIKLRKPSDALEAPFGTVVELIREAFTARSISSATYAAAVSLLGVPLLIDLMSLAGMYASTAALLNVFDMQLGPGETHLLPPLDQRLRRPLTASGRRTACRSGTAGSRRSTSMARKSPDT